MVKKKKEAEEEMKHKGQSWSIDIIVGVIIFMLIIAVFYAFLSSRAETSLEDLQEEAQVTTSMLTRSGELVGLKILNDKGEIDKAKLDALCSKPYAEVKRDLGVSNDFCIFLEDENGNLIPCGTDALRAGVGNAQDLNITDNHLCGDYIS